MVAVARECIGTGKSESVGARKNELRDTARSEAHKKVEEKRQLDRGRKTSGMDLFCYYCNERGHIKRFCKKRDWDEAIEKESNDLEKILKGEDQGCQGLCALRDKNEHLNEPLVNLDVGLESKVYEFLVDTGADRSSVKEISEGCKLSDRKCKVKSVKNSPFKVSIIEKVHIKGNFRETYADLLYIPIQDSNRLGQDLQVQLKIGVVPKGGRMVVKTMVLKEEDEEGINLKVKAEGGGSGLLSIPPIKIKIKPGIPPVGV